MRHRRDGRLDDRRSEKKTGAGPECLQSRAAQVRTHDGERGRQAGRLDCHGRHDRKQRPESQDEPFGGFPAIIARANDCLVVWCCRDARDCCGGLNWQRSRCYLHRGWQRYLPVVLMWEGTKMKRNRCSVSIFPAGPPLGVTCAALWLPTPFDRQICGKQPVIAGDRRSRAADLHGLGGRKGVLSNFTGLPNPLRRLFMYELTLHDSSAAGQLAQ